MVYQIYILAILLGPFRPCCC